MGSFIHCFREGKKIMNMNNYENVNLEIFAISLIEAIRRVFMLM